MAKNKVETDSVAKNKKVDLVQDESRVDLESQTTHEDKRVKQYRVVTERQPFYDNSRMMLNHIFTATADDSAIVAMLGRTWIVEV